MRAILDLHIHSRFARGCSKDITVEALEKWARIKGIDVLGTGDFTHPTWAAELEQMLVREQDGIYFTATGMAFVYQTEISLVYTQKRGRRIHILILAPGRDVAKRITQYFAGFGRLDYDGRPTFGIPAWQVVRDLRAIDERIEVIPAHAWTPWFSVFGSKSGFDSLKECFLDETQHIHAIETGLSADILMNERVASLDAVRKVSFSDAHSFWPWRLGREVTIVDIPRLSYDNILKAIRTGKGLWGTVEVEPAYGKYHFDGHRACGVMQDPAMTRRKVKKEGADGKRCPVCGRELTIGVLYRVEELADRPARAKARLQNEQKLVPLSEIISLVLGKGVATKTVWDEYWRIMKTGKNEFDILLTVPEKELLRATQHQDIVKTIMTFRKGDIQVDPPGYDGVYGKPRIPGVELHTEVLKGD